MAKLYRILNLLILRWCVLEQNTGIQHFWVSSPVKHKVEQKETNNPASIGLLLASAVPGIMHSVAIYT